MSDENLNEYQQRKLKKQDEQLSTGKAGRGKWFVWLVLVGIVGFVGYSLYRRYSVPVVGELMADQGREHVQDIANFSYNSNPPTSGDHFAVWAKKGVYDRIISDGHLIHSLEHGYIVISYDCTKPQATSHWPLATSVYAHEEGDDIPEGELHPEATGSAEASGSGKPLMRSQLQPSAAMSAFTPENAPVEEVSLSEAFSSDSCKQLVGQVKEFYGKNSSKRLVVVPRVGMDTPIALTAWTRILKLPAWDEKQVKLFLDAWENKGPEQTVE